MSSSAPRQSKVGTHGDEYIRFKVPHSILGSIKADDSNRAAKMNKLAAVIDAESLPFVGVPLSGLIIPSAHSNLNTGPHLFKSKTGSKCLVYSAGEDAKGFYLVISKLTPKNAKGAWGDHPIAEPKKFET